MSSRSFIFLNFCMVLILLSVMAIILRSDVTEAEDRMSAETLWVHLAHRPDGYGLFRFVDYEASVVCWLFQTESGLSCLPLSETTLKRQEE